MTLSSKPPSRTYRLSYVTAVQVEGRVGNDLLPSCGRARPHSGARPPQHQQRCAAARPRGELRGPLGTGALQAEPQGVAVERVDALRRALELPVRQVDLAQFR